MSKHPFSERETDIRSSCVSSPRKRTSRVSASSLAKYTAPTKMWSWRKYSAKISHGLRNSSGISHPCIVPLPQRGQQFGEYCSAGRHQCRRSLTWSNNNHILTIHCTRENIPLQDSRWTKSASGNDYEAGSLYKQSFWGAIFRTSYSVVNIFDPNSTGVSTRKLDTTNKTTEEATTHSNITRTTRLLSSTFRFSLWLWL
jgi:hypothetical protein